MPIDSSIYVTRHFRWDELCCTDGTPVPLKFYKNAIDLITELELVRRIWKKPISILSGYRTPAWNKKVGGAKKSMHLTASACDIVVATIPAKEVADAIEAGIADGAFHFGGLGRYKSFVHLDTRPGKARWEG